MASSSGGMHSLSLVTDWPKEERNQVDSCRFREFWRATSTMLSGRFNGRTSAGRLREAEALDILVHRQQRQAAAQHHHHPLSTAAAVLACSVYLVACSAICLSQYFVCSHFMVCGMLRAFGVWSLM